jgi:hypothetical protein
MWVPHFGLNDLCDKQQQQQKFAIKIADLRTKIQIGYLQNPKQEW